MPANQLCVLCRCTSVNNYKSTNNYKSFEESKATLINQFWNNIQLNCGGDDESSETTTGEQLNSKVITICGGCCPLVESTMEMKKQMDLVENGVRKLQLQLLQEMNHLLEAATRFYGGMKKIDVLMGDAETLAFSNPMKTLPMQCLNEVAVFGRRIKRVVKDLSAYQRILSKKADIYVSGGGDAKIGSEHTLTVPVPKIDVDEQSVLSFSETGEATAGNFLPGDISVEDAELNHENDGTDDENYEMAAVENSGGSTDDSKVSEEKEVCNGRRKRIKRISRNARTHRSKTSLTSLLNSVDMEGMSEFKKELIKCVLQRKNRMLQASLSKLETQKAESDDLDDPQDRYSIDYNKETDTFSVEDVQIILYEEENQNSYIECSKCAFRVRESVHKGSQVPFRMLNHILGKHLNVYNCRRCGRKITHRGTFLEHIQSHLETCACDICGKPISHRKKLKEHKLRHMNEKERNEFFKSAGVGKSERKAKKDKPFQCSTCGRSFRLKGGLQSHEETHLDSNRRTTVCPICGKKLLERTYLYCHQKICKPPGEKTPPVKCLQCDKTFVNLEGMKIHFERVHSEKRNERSHICPVCGKGFKFRNEMTTHLKTHSEKTFECRKGCGTKFKTVCVRRNHEKVCTGSGTRPGPKGKRKLKAV